MSEKQNERLHNFDLASFKKAQSDMIATSSKAYGGYGSGFGSQSRDYTEKEIKKIIEDGSSEEQQELSNTYFNKDGYYKQIILHYATLLKYVGILIPNPSLGKNLSTPHIQKKYYAALDLVERMNLPEFCVNCAKSILVNGVYFGLIVKDNKNTFSVVDLPISYCKSNFRDMQGNDLVEFDLSYFNTITKKEDLEAALAAYPDFISKAYRKWRNSRGDKWVLIPSEYGICFQMFDGRPFFLDVIPATMQYEEAVETEQEKDKEEIRKIIVQKIPHLNDGRLLFEPDEAVELHNGAVGMVRNNKNTTVLTTYTDVDAITSKQGADVNNNALERMQQNIYSQAGVSGEIFAATGGNTTETSIKYDTAIMMNVANKFARFVTNIVNKHCSNANITFKYTILPVTYHNAEKYIDSSYKLSSCGYSLLIPALAQGLSQRDLVNVNDLENGLLDLTSKLIPPQTAYTQTGEEGEEGGRPTKESGEKKDQTIKNEESIEKSKTQGGSE